MGSDEPDHDHQRERAPQRHVEPRALELLVGLAGAAVGRQLDLGTGLLAALPHLGPDQEDATDDDDGDEDVADRSLRGHDCEHGWCCSLPRSGERDRVEWTWAGGLREA